MFFKALNEENKLRRVSGNDDDTRIRHSLKWQVFREA